MRIPPIKAVMTPFPYTIDAGESMQRAEETLAEHAIRHLPVINGETLVGVVSEREVETARRAGFTGRELNVRDLATHGACVVDLDEPLDNVLLRMADQRIDCALVTRQGKLAGIFTTTDACVAYAELLRSGRPEPGDDAA